MEKLRSSIGGKFAVFTIAIMFGMVLLPSMGKSIAIGLFAISVILLSFKRPFHIDKQFLFINGALYFCLFLTLFYSENSHYAFRKLGTLASLIVFPILFSLLRREHRNLIFQNHLYFVSIYVIGVFLFNVVAFLWFYTTNYSFSGMMEHFATVVRVDMGKFSIHPIYLSMHCAAAIIFSLYLFKKIENKKLISLLIVVDLTLLAFLLLYAKKGPILALIVVFSLFVAFQRGHGKVKPYLIAVGIIIGLTIAIPKTRNKFVELIKIETLDKGTLTSTNIRYTIYDSAKEKISESFLFGYGVGDYNDVLLDSYKEKKQPILIKGEYNSHNQYFSLLLIGGIVILCVFVLTLIINFIYAIRYDNQLLILLLIFYGLVMFTENILEREQGVIYFSLFLNYFSLRSKHLATHANSADS